MDVSLFSNAHHHHHYHHLGFGAPLHTTVIPPHPSLHPHATHPYHHDELSPQISPVVHPDAMYGQILGQEYSAVYPPPSEAALYHATHPYSSQNYEFLFASPTHVHTTALAPYDHHTTPPLTPKTPPAISASSQQHLAHNSSNEPRIFSRFHDEDEENRDEDEEMDQNYDPSDDGPLILNDSLADDSRPKGVASNKKERRRTQCINSAFTSLRDCIPNVPSDTKLSKIKTLRLASSYISYLMDLLEAPQEHSHQLLNEGFRADLTSTKRSSLQNRIETQNEIRRHLEMQLEKAKYKRLHTSSTAQRKRNCSKKSSRNNGNQECSSINVNFSQAEVHSLSSSSSSFAYVKQEIDDCAPDCDAQNLDCSSSHQIWSGVANYEEVATFHQRMTCNTTPLDQQPLPVSPLHSHQIPVAGGAPPSHHSIIGESCSNSSERVTCNKPRTGWPEHVWAQELGAPNTQSSGSVTVSGSDH